MFQATWKKLVLGHETDGSDVIPPPLPPRLVTDDDLKQFNEAMKIYDEVPKGDVESNGVKRKRGALGGLDTQHYGRGKRAREVVFLFYLFELFCQLYFLYFLSIVINHHRIYIHIMKFRWGNTPV
jgi:hypothetical protein